MTAPDRWDRKVAGGLAFLRRRIAGEYEVDEFGFDAELTERVFQPMLRFLYRDWFRTEVFGTEHLPAEGPALVEEWYGWRPMTPDDLPMLGRAPDVDNLVVATGHGMLGVTMSAATGEVVADLVSHRPAGFDLAPFDPARFR